LLSGALAIPKGPELAVGIEVSPATPLEMPWKPTRLLPFPT